MVAVFKLLFLGCLVLPQGQGAACELEEVCPWQGGHIEDVYRMYYAGMAAERECIFRSLQNDRTCVRSQASVYETHESPSIPDSQLWSRCQHCAWASDKGRFIIFREGITTKRSIDLSWSSWGEFFHDKQNDFLQADEESLLEESDMYPYLYIDRPVFVLPIITFCCISLVDAR